MIDVNPQDPIPIYLQIVRGIQRQIQRGALQPGDRLPTVRDLAVRVRVNRNTAARAIQQLESEGWVRTHVGKGTFVEARTDDGAPSPHVDAMLSGWLDDAERVGDSLEALIERLRHLARSRNGRATSADDPSRGKRDA